MRLKTRLLADKIFIWIVWCMCSFAFVIPTWHNVIYLWMPSKRIYMIVLLQIEHFNFQYLLTTLFHLTKIIKDFFSPCVFCIGRFYLSIAVAFPFVGHVFHILFGSTRPFVICILLYISAAPPTDWRLRFGAKALRRCLIRWHTRHQMVLLRITSKNFDELPKIEMELSISFCFLFSSQYCTWTYPLSSKKPALCCIVLT